MSRAALMGTFVFVVAGLSGCASPAHMVKFDRQVGQVVIAVPEDTNSWPFYHQDEAIKAAGQYVQEPILVAKERVKVGEQVTNTQDATRQDIGGDKKPKIGEVTTSTSTTSVSDKYEYQMVFESANKGAGKFLEPRYNQKPPIPAGTPMQTDPMIKPVAAVEPKMSPPPVALDIKEPLVVPPPDNSAVLPATNIGGPR